MTGAQDEKEPSGQRKKWSDRGGNVVTGGNIKWSYSYWIEWLDVNVDDDIYMRWHCILYANALHGVRFCWFGANLKINRCGVWSKKVSMLGILGNGPSLIGPNLSKTWAHM